MTIILLHKHYDPTHLAEVTEQMRTRGAPTIRAIKDKTNGMWWALEGCHRIRAAHELGLTPRVIDVGSYDDDGYIDHTALEGVTINSLTDDNNLTDDPDREALDYITDPNNTISAVCVDFDDEEED